MTVRKDGLLGVVAVQQVHLMLYQLFVEANIDTAVMGLKQWSTKLTPSQRALLESLLVPQPQLDDIRRAHVAALTAFVTEGRATAEAAGVAWPVDLHRAIHAWRGASAIAGRVVSEGRLSQAWMRPGSGMARWCLETAGERIHGTTQRRPRECFEQEEKPRLLPAPECFYELPLYAQPKVHRDFHIEVGRALYSVPHHLIGEHVHVRGDRHLVKVFHRGRLIKVHPRKPPGGRSTDPQDFPDEKRVYAFRDLEYLKRVAAGHGAGVGAYAEQLLNSPLPWTRMRQVYRLLGLVRRYGAERVEQACQRALDLDVIDVTRINRMLERALEASSGRVLEPGKLVQLRFARSSDEFLISKEARPDE